MHALSSRVRSHEGPHLEVGKLTLTRAVPTLGQVIRASLTLSAQPLQDPFPRATAP